MLKKDPNKLPDGRKFRLALISIMLLTAAFAMAAINPVLATALPDFITGLIGLNLVYNGGNVGNKWMLGKKGGVQLGQVPDSPPTPKEDEA